MLDLLIVHPGAAHGIYGSDLAASLVAVEPPVWARMLAGYAQDRGYIVRIIDAEAEGLGAEDVSRKVVELQPSLICLAVYGHQPSASTQQMVGASAIARAIKARSEIPIIMVGGHVAALPEQTLAQEQVDFTCNGEGPETIDGLLAGEPVSRIPGLVYRDATGIQMNLAAPLVPIDELHGDAWDLLPMHLYRAHNWQVFDGSPRKPYASIMTSLGCPFGCLFCCINAPFGGRRYRTRKPSAVVAEIVKLYEEYGVRTFKIVDEMFILNEQHYTEICRGLLDHGLGFAAGLNIWAYARIDTVKSDSLALLRKAGFRWLALGIESGSRHVRDGASKRLRNNDIVHVVRAVQQAGINVIANYIFGLRDDDLHSMRTTLALARECRTEFANFYSAMAYPGSSLYATAKLRGWTLPESWRGYSQHNDDCRPLDTEHVDAATVLRFRDEAFQTYFTDLDYLAFMQDKFGSAVVEHIKAMTTIKLRRKLLESVNG